MRRKFLIAGILVFVVGVGGTVFVNRLNSVPRQTVKFGCTFTGYVLYGLQNRGEVDCEGRQRYVDYETFAGKGLRKAKAGDGFNCEKYRWDLGDGILFESKGTCHNKQI